MKTRVYITNKPDVEEEFLAMVDAKKKLLARAHQTHQIPTYAEWHATTPEGRRQARALAEMQAYIRERDTLPWWRLLRRAWLTRQCNALR